MKRFTSILAIAMMAVSSMLAATTTDGLMTTQPEGTLKVYDRSGYAYYVYNDYVRRGAQTGTISIVFAENNDVYMLDPISKAITGVWVKGTLSSDGKTITLPLGQVIAHDTDQNDDVVLGKLYYDEDEEEVTTQATTGNMTFTVSDGTITLNGSSRYTFFGAVWKTSNAWAEYGDYSSKYTEVVTPDDPVVAPEGLQTEIYSMSTNSYSTGRAMQYNINMGLDGNDVYIQGAYSDLPNAWIKGTKSGNTLTFPSGQYLAPTTTGTTSYYMIAVNHSNTSEIQDFVLTYDETTGQYTSTQYLVLNTAKTTVYLVDAFDNIVIEKKLVDGAYNVPYSGTFTGGLNDFTVIDANNDGVTWIANKMNGTAEYNWSTTNAANDWLITPRINLEAGKQYTITVVARSMAGQLEKFEIKMGTEATVESMTTQVLNVVNVETGDFMDFPAVFTVAENGAYRFGVHAVSDADNNGLYIQEVKVEEGDTSAISDLHTTSDNKAVKTIENGQVVITVNGVKYNATGARIK